MFSDVCSTARRDNIIQTRDYEPKEEEHDGERYLSHKAQMRM